MANKLSINEIKKLLSKVTNLSDIIFDNYSDDPRKGVQEALKNRINKIKKTEQAKVEFQKRLKYEHFYWDEGVKYIAGVDEVGRGPLAGPVVTAAVILPNDFDLYEVNDSKKLSPQKRLSLSKRIKKRAAYYSVGIASNKIIDKINIYEATRLAMKDAVIGLGANPEVVIVDAMNIDIPNKQVRLVKGDSKSASVAAASILAKVYRDHLMDIYSKKYPEYDFIHNAGYGTQKHLKALEEYGATPIHRKSFKPVSDFIDY